MRVGTWNAIREGKVSQINNQIQTGRSRGMISMDQSLLELVRSGTVNGEAAFERAFDRESFRSALDALKREMGELDVAPPRMPGLTR